MLGKWLNRGKDAHPSFKNLEKSASLDETYKLARELPDNPYFDETLRGHLNEHYGVNDKESYDCHSFATSVAKRELSADLVIAPGFERPEQEKFDSHAEWVHELGNAVKRMFLSTEGKKYVDSQRALTTNIYNNSGHIPIPHIPAVMDERWDESRKNIARHITEEVVKEISKKGASRVLLFSANERGKFRDIHSSIILGITKDGKDVLLLEKLQTGDSIQIRLLSDTIEMQMLPYSENLTLNILRKPIARMTT